MNGIFHKTIHTDTNRARIARAFGRGAASYDSHAVLQRDVADRLLSRMPAIDACATVLDLGCGTGYCTKALQQRLPNGTMLAFDLAEPMLQLARARCDSTVQLACGDAQALPLRSDSIDCVFSSLTVQWCSDLPSLFSELQRVLSPGGHALLSTLGPQTLQELRAAWQQVDTQRHSNEFSAAGAWLKSAEAAGLHGSIDSELHIRYYQSLRALAEELKGLGANTVASAHAALPSAFRKASAAFEQKRVAAGIPVSWEIYYLFLQKPD